MTIFVVCTAFLAAPGNDVATQAIPLPKIRLLHDGKEINIKEGLIPTTQGFEVRFEAECITDSTCRYTVEEWEFVLGRASQLVYKIQGRSNRIDFNGFDARLSKSGDRMVITLKKITRTNASGKKETVTIPNKANVFSFEVI